MAKTKTSKALQFERRFTKEGVHPFDLFEYDFRTSVIKNPTGEKVFEMTNVEVPKQWSQIATDILAQKYFRKAGVPQPDGSKGRETSVKQVAHRMANCWRVWGERYGYFATKKDADIFYEELVYSILNQSCVPNSPQWFNTGLHESYGITGKPQGHYYVDPKDKKLKKSQNAYERPQPHACFILSVSDDLVNEGGIMDLWVREARIFKYGSGVGTNFSQIRGSGEKLSGGGTSSGLMSFLKIGDRAAGAIKSGGTTRRAAKMVCLDLDHPEIVEFINWKVGEEDKVAALVAAGYDSSYEGEAYATVSGQNSNNSIRIPNSFFKVLEEDGNWELKARTDGHVMKTIKARELWNQIAYAAWRCADPGTQYDTTINEWHTCPEGGRINASNPCSEYMFLDNTACNLASIMAILWKEQSRSSKIAISNG
ncbi:MAG: vitamin B12-dependent ribonucleotide reductase, partial [Chitinophagaceae bacterium]